ncbi:MAG TPA: tetratricopeptide repeat protein [Gemmataceae bacterium]|jgi:tetratricopeptide (TPR) repeat protein|nr:tetratricopeptide repeat protein [Gemmataceae bacterium]
MVRFARGCSPRLLLLTCLLGLPSPSHSGEADRLALARLATNVLKANCYRCHGQDGAIEGGMNYILDVRTLVSRRKVVPGRPAKSRVFKRLTSRNNPMPPEEEKVRPGKEDIALVKRWIEAGAPDPLAAPAERALLAEADILRLIHDDLRIIDERQRRFLRYFTLTNLYNAGLSDDQLATYRHGLSKLVNSLSWEPDIAVPRAIDPARTVLRIDLRNYKWSAEVWQQVVGRYPYGIVSTTPVARAVHVATGCDMPSIRADWFVFAGSRPPLYHDVLQLPRTDVDVEKELRVEAATDIQEERVARAGFNGSGVSRNNRLIERHKSGYGAYWKSYDFAGNAGRRNLFAHPLGPGPDDTAFRHDGGEIIFNLPNGLQAYMLVDGTGKRIDEGPSKIVSIRNRQDPTVFNGVSCMLCHARGMIDKADQVRAHVEKNPSAFTDADARAIRALYRPAAEFKALLQKDAEHFRKAAEATGVKLGGTEPVAALAARFEAELDVNTAAGELSLKPKALLQGLGRLPDLAQRLGSLKTEGGTVQRQVFVEAFDDLVRGLGVGTTLHALNEAVADASAAIRSDPANAAAYVDRANARYDKGDYDRAVADYSEAIRLELKTAAVYQNRGMAHALTGDYDQAIADYDEAIRLDANSAETYHNRALAHAKKGAYARAVADLTSTLRLEPKNAVALGERGVLHAKLGHDGQALADYDSALRLDPRLSWVSRERHKIREKRDKARHKG